MQALSPFSQSITTWNQASALKEASTLKSSTKKIPFTGVDQAFSNDLKQFWNKDFKTSYLNSIKELFNKYIWNKTVNELPQNEELDKFENESKKRKAVPDYWYYRHGLFFTNWPPFSFSEEDGRGVWNGCKQIVFSFPHKDRKNDDIFLLNINIGSGNTCLLYKEQVECIKKSLSEFFSYEGVYNNPKKLFAQNSTDLSWDEGSIELPSQILPLNWTVSYLANRKVSPEFLEELKSGLEHLTQCEREAYLKETLGFSFLVGGAATFLLFACCAGILHFFLAKKTTKTESSDLTEVVVNNYGSFKN